MKNFKRVLALLLACMLLFSLTACGNKEAAVPADSKASTDSVASSASTTPPPEEEKIDPLGKYETPITITTALRTTPSDTYPMDGTNIWGKKYAEYGINMKVLWTADASQYENKLNTVIAAGDIPDLFTNASPQQMNTLVKADMAADLTDTLNKWLLPQTKELLLGEAAKNAIEAVTYDGKIRFIPQNITENQADVFPLFIRQDWLKNLNLEIPKTLDDLKKIAIAFTKDDPDKNGKKDTYGIALAGQKNLLTDWGGLYGFFAGYKVQPCIWYDGMLFYSKDESGKAVWDGTRPETKEGLQFLADLYKDGAIPKDFATMDSAKITAELNGGRAGLVFGARGLPFWAIQNTIKNDPKAEWYAMNMPTKDGSHPVIFGWQPVNVATVISKTCKNPEAVVKMLNIQWNFTDDKSPNYNPDYVKLPENEQVGPAYVGLYNAESERASWNKLFDAISSKDPSAYKQGQTDAYDKYFKYEETKDPELWGNWNASQPKEGGAFYTVWRLNKPEDVKKNVWWSMPNDQMNAKLQLFRKMADEEVVKIICGIAPVSDWDSMIKKWNSVGGDDITKMVNDNMK